MRWITCPTCSEEYKVVTGIGVSAPVVFCPFCGSETAEGSDDDGEDIQIETDDDE